jgi:NAD(P)-dependent dehydrogenase (short-subunit alcohol dehydrogenase family)
MAEDPGIVVVTGGATGIGEACASLLIARGWRAVIAGIDLDVARKTASRIGAEAVHLDVSNSDQVERVASECERRFGAIAGLVASAGIIQAPTSPEDYSIDDFDRVIAVNFRGAYLTCRAFGARMARRNGGAIVTIGSITALRSAPLPAYAPSKAAVVHMTQCLAAEWARSGVRINAVSPGYVATAPLREAFRKGERNPETLSESAAMGRMVEPLEVAKAVAFLLSSEASAITGVNLPVDAGWLVGAHLVTYGGVPGPRRGAGSNS